MPHLGNGKEQLADPACRSGYEYAKRHDGIWRGESTEVLRTMTATFMELYLREGNGNSLGIAMYLQELLDSRSGEGEG